MYPTPHRDEALCFYRAALPAAALLDRDAPHRMLDAEADHAWRAYDSTLPSAIRFDLVLRDLSLLYPAAFAPGPVFRLAGWYDDDPWGVGFERPPKDEVEAVFRKREAPRDVNDALERVRLAWSIGRAESKSVAFAERLSPTSQLVVAGARAMLAVAQAEAVPSATSQVYTDKGIETRRLREQCWDLQRREDAGEQVTIEVPPKYDRKDYQNASVVWRHRGKLDVPKERFISYPTATPPPGATGASGRVFGWAGWNHLEQLQAVIALWQDEWTEHGSKLLPRATRETAPEDRQQADADARTRLLPLLQTMVDLLPWVKQWHDEDGETAQQFETYVAEECLKLEMSREDVRKWRAPKVERRGRVKAAGRAKAKEVSKEAVLGEIKRALQEGAGEVVVSELGGRLGVAAGKVKAVVDELVEEGTVVEVRRRPRVVRVG